MKNFRLAILCFGFFSCLSCGEPESSKNSAESASIEESADVDVSSTKADDEKLPITVQGRQLLVGGKAFTIKGVCYNPVPKGKSHPEGSLLMSPNASDLRVIESDFKMMKEAGINTIRTYTVIRDEKVLALLNRYEIFVIVPVLNSTQTSAEKVRSTIEALKGHRSTLMWQVGNEWNYNKLYDDSLEFSEAKDLVKKTGALIKALDRSHPLSTDYGEMPAESLIDELKDFDIWGLNIYSGKSFSDRFKRWKAMSNKPMYLGEFGADAINTDHVDLKSQALATADLLREIKSNLSANSANNAVVGGTIFSWVDGWWKDNNGSSDQQDIGGHAPGGGPYPDGIFNEEYWGIVDIDRKIRPAYTELKKVWAED